MSKQGIILHSPFFFFVKGSQARHSGMMQAQQCLLLFTVKFYFWGIAAVSLYSNVVRMDSKLGEMQWKSHYCVHMLEKMLASGQIKCLLLNRNRLVRVLVWKQRKGRRGISAAT